MFKRFRAWLNEGWTMFTIKSAEGNHHSDNFSISSVEYYASRDEVLAKGREVAQRWREGLNLLANK